MQRECWFCNWKYDIIDELQYIAYCPSCGVENDWTPYTPIKEEEMIPESKSTATQQFAPFLSTRHIPEEGFELIITDEWKAPNSPKISSFIVGECEVQGEKFSQGINETTYREIAKKYGVDTKNWIGKKIVYQGKVKMGQRGVLGHLWTPVK